MTYSETAALVDDPDFRGRVTSASSEQALIFINDARPEYIVVAQTVILYPGNAGPLVNLVAGQPGITAAATDADILAALQAVWPKYGTSLLASSS
jgi:hypothetical protein